MRSGFIIIAVSYPTWATSDEKYENLWKLSVVHNVVLCCIVCETRLFEALKTTVGVFRTRLDHAYIRFKIRSGVVGKKNNPYLPSQCSNRGGTRGDGVHIHFFTNISAFPFKYTWPGDLVYSGGFSGGGVQGVLGTPPPQVPNLGLVLVFHRNLKTLKV